MSAPSPLTPPPQLGEGDAGVEVKHQIRAMRPFLPAAGEGPGMRAARFQIGRVSDPALPVKGHDPADAGRALDGQNRAGKRLAMPERWGPPFGLILNVLISTQATLQVWLLPTQDQFCY